MSSPCVYFPPCIFPVYVLLFVYITRLAVFRRKRRRGRRRRRREEEAEAEAEAEEEEE